MASPTVRPADRAVLRERLRKKIRTESECHVWTGYRRNGLHGSLWFRGRNIYVHRLSYELRHGPIPPGMVVCHRCDNPACVNPDHLFLGSQADNVADMEGKGRARKVSPRGAANGNARLTDAQAEEIRRLADAGVRQREIANRFGCSQSTVWRIARRVTRAGGTP